jgi:hypothetical protein
MRQRKRFLKSLALLCILGALYYLPIFYPFIQNDILASPPPIQANTRLDLPHYLTKPEYNRFAEIFVTLTTDTDFIVGKPLNLLVSANMPNSFAANSPAGFAIAPDDALYYPVLTIPGTKAVFPAFFKMYPGTPGIDPDVTIWSGNETIEYTVTGAFGLTLVFYNYTTSIPGNLTLISGIGELHTNQMFSIASQDSFVLKRSQSLTMTLTFLLLLFVVLDFIRVEKNREYPKHQDKNGRVKH